MESVRGRVKDKRLEWMTDGGFALGARVEYVTGATAVTDGGLAVATAVQNRHSARNYPQRASKPRSRRILQIGRSGRGEDEAAR